MRSFRLPSEKWSFEEWVNDEDLHEWVELEHSTINTSGLFYKYDDIFVRKDLYEDVKSFRHSWLLYPSKETKELELDLQIDCDFDTFLLLKLGT